MNNCGSTMHAQSIEGLILTKPILETLVKHGCWKVVYMSVSISVCTLCKLIDDSIALC